MSSEALHLPDFAADARLLASPVQLPNGISVPNRICKGAMTESLADARTGLPNSRVDTVYSRWSMGGLGMSITGNITIDRMHREAARNVTCTLDSKAQDFKSYAKSCSANGKTLAIAQISHAGRQTPPAVNYNNLLSSSNKRVLLPGMPTKLFGQPRAMTTEEIKDVINRFVHAAKVMEEAGFHGIEIHSAHGYLLSQFLSPQVNDRTDDYGGSPEKRRRLLVEIIDAVREATSPSFVVGVKINSADFQKGGFSTEESLEVIRAMAPKVDFVELSGGIYESPAMMDGHGVQKKESTKIREAYFLEFAREVRQALPSLILMVTGGFRTRSVMAEAIRSGACDLVGIARPLCLDPDFPNKLLDESIQEDVVGPTAWLENDPKAKDASSFWHTMQIQDMADGKDPDHSKSSIPAQFFLMRHALLEPSMQWPFSLVYNWMYPLSK